MDKLDNMLYWRDIVFSILLAFCETALAPHPKPPLI